VELDGVGEGAEIGDSAARDMVWACAERAPIQPANKIRPKTETSRNVRVNISDDQTTIVEALVDDLIEL
jgi:hypothetical protein